MTRHTFLTLIVAVTLMAAGLIVPSTQAQAQDSPEGFISALGDRTLAVLQDGASNDASKRQALRDLFIESLNIPAMGAFVMGRHWRQMTPEQQSDYLTLVEEFIVTTYSRRFLEFSGQQFSVLGERGETNGDSLVATRIMSPGSSDPVDVQWRVRAYDDGTYKIVDVVIENISQLVTWRNEFNSIIQLNGGDVTSVMDELREGIARQS